MKKSLDIFFVVFIICKILTTISCSAIDTAVLAKTGGKGVCKNGFCGSPSYFNVIKALSGLFHTAPEISMLDKVNNAAVGKDELQGTDSRPQNRDDGDICCATHIEHVNMTTMKNIDGANMTIFHYWYAPEPTTQYIPHASCVRTGSCPGKCEIEYKTLVLLAYNATTPVKFDFFSVPGYCSCKNTWNK
ncbi:uncharacterized protein LOC123531234 [Mercenaria mercenaria]|uniref:uncharacterized protein LOC123531234 n=1 Tax=Mercenaria mercenaria TaxID=6596 RepID=UPI001E1DE1FD|nr:uncharacterized protein LOC123531234 [Mercenaria mercenaria]